LNYIPNPRDLTYSFGPWPAPDAPENGMSGLIEAIGGGLSSTGG